MQPLTSNAPHPALADHPEFAMMLATVLDRYHCTLSEVRQDYWLGRAWRALTSDPALAGRVARIGIGNVLITGPRYGAIDGRERRRWRLAVDTRIAVDTGRTADSLDLSVRFAEEPIEIAQGCMLSLLAQTVLDDERWMDLTPYADDLAPVVVPVAYSLEKTVAA